MGKTYRRDSDDGWGKGKGSSSNRKNRKREREPVDHRYYTSEHKETEWDDQYESTEPLFQKFPKKRKKR